MKPHEFVCQCPECYFWRDARKETKDTFMFVRDALMAITNAAKAWERKANK